MTSAVGVRLVGHVVRGSGRSLPLALAATLLVTSAPSAARARAMHAQRAGDAPRQAQREARLLLRGLPLPDGARAGGSTGEGASALRGPGSQPAAPNLLDVHRFWQLPGEPGAAAEWFHGHPPARAKIRGGASGQRGVWWVRFSFAPRRAKIASEQLVLALVRAPGGGTLLRADAQVAWVARRARR